MNLSSWPTWALRVLDAMLTLAGVCPVLHWRVRLEIGAREWSPERDDDELMGWWCPASGGIA